MRVILSVLVVAGAARAAGADAQPPTLARVASVGCDACAGAAEFSSIADVAVTAGGVIWVATGEAPLVRVFGPDGRHLRSFGRAGAGPGEYARIGMLLPEPGGALSIVDFRHFRVTRVDSTGARLASSQFGAVPIDASLRGREVLVLTGSARPGTGRVIVVGDTVRDARTPLADFPRRDAPGEVRSMAVAPDGSIAIADGAAEYRIRVYPAGGSFGDIVRGVPRTERTSAEMAALEQRMLGQMSQVMAAAGARGGEASPRRPDIPKLKPHLSVNALKYDARGRLWVHTMRGTDTTTVFDVFNADRTFASEVTIPSRVTAFRLGAGYFVAADTDREGIPRVTLWRVDG